jgi:hypothetical protein
MVLPQNHAELARDHVEKTKKLDYCLELRPLRFV